MPEGVLFHFSKCIIVNQRLLPEVLALCVVLASCTLAFAEDARASGAAATAINDMLSRPAVIEGTITDAHTGEAVSDIQVDVYAADDKNYPVATAYTDKAGFYQVEVKKRNFYDAHILWAGGSTSDRTREAVRAGGTYVLNFQIGKETEATQSAVEKYGFGFVVVVAGFVLLIIIVDIVFSRSKKRGPSRAELVNELDEIKSILEISRQKYHKREIDELSFREISKEKQSRIIEIESKLAALDKKS